QRPEHPDERLLGQVLGVLRPAHHPHREGVDLSLVPLDQLPVRLLVAREAPPDEDRVFDRDRPHPRPGYARPRRNVSCRGTLECRPRTRQATAALAFRTARSLTPPQSGRSLPAP